jgi:hypothetical protein
MARGICRERDAITAAATGRPVSRDGRTGLSHENQDRSLRAGLSRSDPPGRVGGKGVRKKWPMSG